MLNKRVEKDDADAKSNPQEADEFRGLTFMSLTFLNEATTSMEFAFFTTSSEAGAGASTSLPAISLSCSLFSYAVVDELRPTPLLYSPCSPCPVTWGNFSCALWIDLEIFGNVGAEMSAKNDEVLLPLDHHARKSVTGEMMIRSASTRSVLRPAARGGAVIKRDRRRRRPPRG